ncbi:hypothetical protein G3567_00560 [Psychroflexus sp. YR1-1]|uniref:Uncharacterized protein n=1 Tax=Psychroflexus aurantiacus TaxID=2709310 RepID=A0A6B3QX06_9FLAO|nr:hypothetical protein [Psychroflexus aurantiacus]NEV92636.1 hypothetical protein [Psychroflexus aurantiacus]
MKSKLALLPILLGFTLSYAQIGIGTTNPDPTSMLEIKSDTAGILIPRMTLAQRDAIVTPAEGLQIFNTTNKSLDLFADGSWNPYSFPVNSNLVYVYSLSDLPAPVSGGITLDETKMYVFSGSVDIGSNYINMNGAGLRGTDPQKDEVVSSVNGAILRSTDKSVYIKELTVAPNSASTQAYDFSDTTGFNFCNIFSGSSVREKVTSLGVGQVSGFSAVTIIQNFWNVTDGLKVTGDMGKFTSAYNFIVGITSGSGIEFESGAVIDDIDLSNNYLIYSGQTGINIVSGSSIDRGRATANVFRGVGTPLAGIDESEQGWWFSQNTNIPDTRPVGFIYFNNNTTSTTFTNTTDFVKIKGATTVKTAQKFSSNADNQMTYIGRRPITGLIDIVINAISPSNGAGYVISLAKNGTVLNDITSTITALSNNRGFQMVLKQETDLVTGDYLEVFIRSTGSTDPLDVIGLQFNVSD